MYPELPCKRICYLSQAAGMYSCGICMHVHLMLLGQACKCSHLNYSRIQTGICEYTDCIVKLEYEPLSRKMGRKANFQTSTQTELLNVFLFSRSQEVLIAIF